MQSPAIEPKKTGVRKKPVLGNDVFGPLDCENGDILTLYYWDIWMVMVAMEMYQGDLDMLADNFRQMLSTASFKGLDAERKLTHLLDTQGRLLKAGVGIDEVLKMAKVDQMTHYQRQRAHKKVLEQCENRKEWSVPMRNPPSERRRKHALRGYWEQFPESPEPHAQKLEGFYPPPKKYHKTQTLVLAKTFDKFIEQANKMIKSGNLITGQAMLRAFLSVILERMMDDSFGRIGQCYAEALLAYLAVPLPKTGIKDDVFFKDLLELVIWEDFAFTDEYIDGYLETITPQQADICIDHLREQYRELHADHLTYQAEEALRLLNIIHKPVLRIAPSD